MPVGAADRFFRISERGSTIRTELLGGAVHFVGNVFNLVATASVLQVGGLPFVDGVVGGAWAGFIAQLFVGLFSRLPMSVSAGAGPNLTVAYLLAKPTSAGGLGSYQTALTVCMASGLLIMALTLSGAINVITSLVPTSLKHAICVGIGLLCALVGFEQVGMVVRSDEGLIGPGDFMHNAQIWLTLLGLALLTLLNSWAVKGGVLVSMALLTLLDWSLVTGWPHLSLAPYSLPPFTMPTAAPLANPQFWSQVVAMTMLLVFDAMGCIFGLARMAHCIDETTGEVVGGSGMFAAIGASTTAAALCGVSPIVVSGTSAAAIVDGARTGLSACVSGVLTLLVGLPLAHVVAALPPSASAFVLIYLGVSMSADAAHIRWDEPIAAVPAFLCVVSQPFLFSIADGIYMGLAMSLVLNLISAGTEACRTRLAGARGRRISESMLGDGVGTTTEPIPAQHARARTSSSDLMSSIVSHQILPSPGFERLSDSIYFATRADPPPTARADPPPTVELRVDDAP